MRYAAENITSKDDDVTLMVGVDTQVVHAQRTKRHRRSIGNQTQPRRV